MPAVTDELQLILLHGLGATGDVWRGWAPVLDERWSGRWVAPDLPGHGRSPYLSSYGFDALASGVASRLTGTAGIVSGAPTVIVGHSLGGVVGLVLARGGFGLD